MLSKQRRKNTKGFTLIEAIVVVAVVAVLAGVAWSIYTQQVIKNRRTEAIMALTRIANELQGWHSDNLTYAGYAVSPSVTNALTTYTVALNLTPTTYTVTLTPIGSQADDAECSTLTLNNLGVKGYTGTAPSAARCWDTTN